MKNKKQIGDPTKKMANPVNFKVSYEMYSAMKDRMASTNESVTEYCIRCIKNDLHGNSVNALKKWFNLRFHIRNLRARFYHVVRKNGYS